MAEMLEQEDTAEDTAESTPGSAQNPESDAELIAEAAHSWRFQTTMSPTVLQYVARARGLAPRALTEPFSFCELGCGNGVSSNTLAASLPHGSFTAIDPKSECIANGKRLAQQGGLTNVSFIESDFDRLAELELPPFDYIVLQGVLSAVSAETRRRIVEFIGKALKPGGLVYAGYNAMPGWAPMLPLRDLMLSYTSLKRGGKFESADQGLRYLRYLRDNQAVFFTANPGADRFLNGLLKQDPAAVVDEYLNPDWQPLYFSQVAEAMAGAGLAYCGSSQIERNYTDLIVPKEHWELLDTAPNEVVRETHKSLILNESLRRDIYFKKADPVPAERRAGLFDDLVFGANYMAEHVKREVEIGLVQVRLGGPIYDALIPAAADGRRSFAEIMALPEIKGQDPRGVLTAMSRLVASGQFRLYAARATAPEGPAPERLRIASAFNRAMLEERLALDSMVYLASPVLGNGVAIDLVQGLLLMGHDAAGPDKAVDHAMELVERTGFPWQAGGKIFDDNARLRQVLERAQLGFRQLSAPLLLRFGIVEAG